MHMHDYAAQCIVACQDDIMLANLFQVSCWYSNATIWMGPQKKAYRSPQWFEQRREDSHLITF